MPNSNPNIEIPDPSSPTYRTQVQTRIQGLVSGNQPRDPHLSSVSTGRLIVEGVVENVRLYRLYKEEEARKERRRERRMERGEGRRRHRSRREEDGGRRHGDEGERQHRDRDEEGRRHQRRDKGEKRHRHQSRDGDERRRHRSRDGSHCDRSRQRGTNSNDEQHMMSGGAGPAGTLPPNAPPLISSHHPNSPSSPIQRKPHPNSPTPHNQHPVPSPPTSHSPSRHRTPPSPPSSQLPKTGPDGTTPFGALPQKLAGVGLAAHFFNTYRHIKAEHDGGHRSRGRIEKVVDGWRGKTGGRKALSDGGKVLEGEDRGRKRDGGRDKRKDDDDDGRRGRRDDRHRSERHRNDDRRKRGGTSRHADLDVDKDLPRRPATPYEQRDVSPSSKHNERAQTPPPRVQHHEFYDDPPELRVRYDESPPAQSRSETPQPPISSFGPGSGSPQSSEIRVSAATPAAHPPPRQPTPSSFRPDSSSPRSAHDVPEITVHEAKPPASEVPWPPNFVPPRSVSPPYPATPQAVEPHEKSVTPMPSSTHIPAPPPMPTRPRPPPPPVPVSPPPNRNALFDQINGGAFNLEKVARTEDEVYGETMHSRGVEEKEREQAQAWSDVGEEENETERRRVLRGELEGRMRGGGNVREVNAKRGSNGQGKIFSA